METFHQKQQQPAHMFISVLRPKSHLKAEEKSMEIQEKNCKKGMVKYSSEYILTFIFQCRYEIIFLQYKMMLV